MYVAVHIRLATADDGEAIAAIYRPVVAETAISFETTVPDRDEMVRRIDETMRLYPWLVCDVDGRTAGYAYASRHRVRGAYQWSVDTSVYIAEDHRRRHIGRSLYTSLFAILAGRDTSTLSRESPCQIRRAWHCTSPWFSSPLVSIDVSGSSSIAGTTWAGGN